jgi:hypothetical protein
LETNDDDDLDKKESVLDWEKGILIAVLITPAIFLIVLAIVLLTLIIVAIVVAPIPTLPILAVIILILVIVFWLGTVLYLFFSKVVVPYIFRPIWSLLKELVSNIAS